MFTQEFINISPSTFGGPSISSAGQNDIKIISSHLGKPTDAGYLDSKDAQCIAQVVERWTVEPKDPDLNLQLVWLFILLSLSPES